MDPEQIDRGVDSATKFIKEKMLPADMIALVSLSTNMHVDLDFTDDKKKVLSVAERLQFQPGPGLRRRRRRFLRRRSRNRRLLHARRHRLQHLHRRSKISRTPVAHAVARENLTEKIHHLFQQRNHAIRRRQSIRSARRNGRRGESKRLDLSARRARLAGFPSGRRSAKREPARPIRIQRHRDLQRSQRQRQLTGNALDARRRHRRQSLLRLQRFQRRLRASAERHVRLLRSRFHQHEPRERRPLPPSQSRPQSPAT